MKISDEQLAELIEWHCAFPFNANGVDTLAALRELAACRAELREAQAIMRAFSDDHRDGCTCRLCHFLAKPQGEV